MANSDTISADPDNIVEYIFKSAVDMKASDVHLEPSREGLSVRLRIDGMLYPLENLTQYPQEETISRLKVLAELNIMEKRLPQDGRIEFEYNGVLCNFRISTTPTIYGEAVVLRVLNREAGIIGLEQIGFSESQLELVRRVVTSPFGMVITTGPTGSGKTTFMYSMLSSINRPERNIVTLEDPVEFQFKNVRQMQINEAISWTFSKAMRAVVRQDPDVIMIGEIRDADTAQMAFQAALTGRLVFSTFHTFDVPGLIIRLIEMGLPRSVVAHTITAVMSCRLVRKTCAVCAQVYPAGEVEKKVFKERVEQIVFKKGAGCQTCHNTGYIGRIGIFEIVYFDEEIRSNIMEEKPSLSLRNLIDKKEIETLYFSAMAKVESGLTTVEELVRTLGLPLK